MNKCQMILLNQTLIMYGNNQSYLVIIKIIVVVVIIKNIMIHIILQIQISNLMNLNYKILILKNKIYHQNKYKLNKIIVNKIFQNKLIVFRISMMKKKKITLNKYYNILLIENQYLLCSKVKLKVVVVVQKIKITKNKKSIYLKVDLI